MWVFPEIRTLGDIPRYHARRRPDAPAVVSGGRTTSFSALDRESNAVANALLAGAFGKDARIGFLGKNSWRLAAAEIAAVLQDSECVLVFVDEDLLGLAGDAVRRAGLALPLVSMPAAKDSADSGWLAFLAAHADTDRGLEVPGDTTALQVYTSGTTGVPKGVELTHDNFNYIRLCEHLDPGIPWSESDVYLMFMPSFHTSGTGLMLQSLYNGGAVSMLPAFDPVEVLRAIAQTRPSIMLIVPSALQALLEHPMASEVDFSCFRLCMYAGSPIALPLIKKAMAEMQCRFVQWYGATEIVGAATLLRAEQHRFDREDQLKSCGTPVPLAEIRIVDPAGNEVPTGQVGEILIRIPSVFKGYWKRPKETAAAKVNGWYKSGDAGYRDSEGYLYIHDRIKDMIVSGGENIYSAEIERVLAQHSALMAAAVIGVPDAKWGEAVKALVVVREGHAVTEAELIAFCREHIGGYKVPKSVDFVDDLPRTASGKLQKAILRAPYWKCATRAVG